jgi:hypothetical protein
VSAWATAFVATQVIEVPVVSWVLKGRAPGIRIAASAVLATAITHPILWFVLPPLFDDHFTMVATGEIAIVLVEAVVLWLATGIQDRRRCFAASALANGTSYLVGVLFF